MKTFSSIFSVLLLCLFANLSYAQKVVAASGKQETVSVWGECGRCKKTIETALSAGATAGSWNKYNKMLSVCFVCDETSRKY
jgi:periplasmic mercuric ion binding protein